jgi:hypothetical protein
MKKGFLLIVIICLAFFGSFEVVDLSEAKDKMSKYDRRIMEEFKGSFSDSAEGRFQTTKMDDTTIFIIDTKLGHCWVFRTSPGPMVKYAGKVRPGTSFWDTIVRQK